MNPNVLNKLLRKKSIWKKQAGNVWDFLCPLCRMPRRLPFGPRPGSFRHYFQIVLTTAVFVMALWKWWGIKGAVVFLPLWIGFEIYYRLRTRAALSCRNCGFDPYLYHIDLKWARREIESHWRKKFADKGIPYPEKGKNNPPQTVAAPSNSPGNSP